MYHTVLIGGRRQAFFNEGPVLSLELALAAHEPEVPSRRSRVPREEVLHGRNRVRHWQHDLGSRLAAQAKGRQPQL